MAALALALPGVPIPQIGRRAKRIAALKKIRDNTNNIVIPDDEIAWNAATHWPTLTRALTAEDPRAPTPKGFKGVLYDPQATMLHAMLEFEKRPMLRMHGPVLASDGSAAILMQADRGLIREQFSFGKTVLAMALICASRRPRPLPKMANIIMIPDKSGINRAVVTTDTTQASSACVVSTSGPCKGYVPELVCRFSRILDATVVCAASAVITQWADNVKQFTSLRYFIVENVKTLREFEVLYRANKLAAYSIILVKVGRVTANFTIEGETKKSEHQTQRSLLGALASVLEGVTVARLIVDDFDSIKLGGDDCFIPALFTWMVSATRRTTTARAHSKEGKGVGEFLKNNANAFPILGTALDDITYGALSLKCDPQYVAQHINTTTMKFRRVVVKGGQAAAILRNLGVADDIVEMINGDAVSTAAETLGINAKSVGDIISRILHDRKGKYRAAIQILKLINYACEALAGKDGEEEDKEAISSLRTAIKSGSEPAVDDALSEMGGSSSAVKASLKSLEEWAVEQRDTFGKTLARMRDNIREKQCQCCMIPFGGEDDAGDDGVVEDAQDAFILNCCQIIVCETCIIVKSGVIDANGTEKRRFIERCPNCAHFIDAEKDLIRVGKELSLDEALTDDVILQDAPKPSTEECPLPEEKVADDPSDSKGDKQLTREEMLDALDNPRLKALIQIVQGDAAVDCITDEETPPTVQGLLRGVRTVAWPAALPRKFIIFAGHAESTRVIADAFDKMGVGNVVLRGRRQDKDDIRERFRTDSSVSAMLVTAREQCSGMHLPWVSDVVFYCHISDSEVKAQAAARIQRLGREYSACVHRAAERGRVRRHEAVELTDNGRVQDAPRLGNRA